MAFEWNRMGRTPEARLSDRQESDRSRMSPETLSASYDPYADKLLQGKDSSAVRDEVGRFAKRIEDAREGSEQDGFAEDMINALRLRGVDVPGGIDSARERAAWVLALARRYLQSLH